ncbi:hypothetical protein Nepgr_001652 [Nepenthes gracilis]|uniref:Uncharacterized protein n=1 Tax=Nepenthes gracilis TaxID=150966 RepID=A0AAD3P7J5_NEPGR|nr:hypothetical protein Nepgr_001652 [Nepenthes gracilis]
MSVLLYCIQTFYSEGTKQKNEPNAQQIRRNDVPKCPNGTLSLSSVRAARASAAPSPLCRPLPVNQGLPSHCAASAHTAGHPRPPSITGEPPLVTAVTATQPSTSPSAVLSLSLHGFLCRCCRCSTTTPHQLATTVNGRRRPPRHHPTDTGAVTRLLILPARHPVAPPPRNPHRTRR